MSVPTYPNPRFRKFASEEREGSHPLQRSPTETAADSSPSLGLFVSLIEHGESVRGAARRSGLSAEQVLEWVDDDSGIGDEMNAAGERIQKQVRFRLTALAHAAVDVVERAIANGDPRIAVDVLVGLGMIEGAPRQQAVSGPDSE